jgi:hypothetical protein
MPRFSNRPFLATTLSFLSSRGQPRDLQCAIRVPRPRRPTTSTNHHRILMEAPTSPLSFRVSRRGPRNCRSLLEMRKTILKQICHLACPGVPWDRCAAEWRDLRFSFTSSRFESSHESVLTAVNQRKQPDFVLVHSPQSNRHVTSSKRKLFRYQLPALV